MEAYSGRTEFILAIPEAEATYEIVQLGRCLYLRHQGSEDAESDIQTTKRVSLSDVAITFSNTRANFRTSKHT